MFKVHYANRDIFIFNPRVRFKYPLFLFNKSWSELNVNRILMKYIYMNKAILIFDTEIRFLF